MLTTSPIHTHQCEHFDRQALKHKCLFNFQHLVCKHTTVTITRRAKLYVNDSWIILGILWKKGRDKNKSNYGYATVASADNEICSRMLKPRVGNETLCIIRTRLLVLCVMCGVSAIPKGTCADIEALGNYRVLYLIVYKRQSGWRSKDNLRTNYRALDMNDTFDQWFNISHNTDELTA